MESLIPIPISRLRNKLSRSQYEEMIAFMENYPALVRGKLDTHFTLRRRQQLWLELTSILNSDPSGVTKTEGKWRKTWSDLKCNAKNKATSIRKQLSNIGEGPVQCSERISDLEERVLKLMGYDQQHDTVECVSESVVKVEPPDESEEAADDSHATMFLEDLESSSFDVREFRVEVANSEVPGVFMVLHEKQDMEVDKQNEGNKNMDTETVQEIENNTGCEREKERNLNVPLSTTENHMKESPDLKVCDPIVDSEKMEPSVPPKRKRILPEEISDTSQERKRARFEEADFSVKISQQPTTQAFDTAINAFTSAVDVPQGFEASVNALTSAINKYIELRKREITMKERKLLLMVKQLRAREKLARAVERIADAKEKKRTVI